MQSSITPKLARFHQQRRQLSEVSQSAFRKRRDHNRILSVAHAVRFHISGTSSWSMWMIWLSWFQPSVPLLVSRFELRRPEKRRIAGGCLPASRFAPRIQDRLCRSAGKSREWASSRSSVNTSSRSRPSRPDISNAPTLTQLATDERFAQTFRRRSACRASLVTKRVEDTDRDPASVSFLVMA